MKCTNVRKELKSQKYKKYNLSVYWHATPAARCPPPAARVSFNVTELSQNVTKCHSAAVPRARRRMFTTPRPPRGVRRLPPARH